MWYDHGRIHGVRYEVAMIFHGVRYEVAMILRYLRNDFPQSPANKFFCDDVDKQNYIQRRCYLNNGINNVQLPTFPQNI